MSQRNAGNPQKWGPDGTRARAAAAAAAAAASSSAASAASPSSSSLSGLLSVLTPMRVAKAVGWSFGWWLCVRLEFGSIYCVVSLIVLMFLSLGSESAEQRRQRTGHDLSAYAVFNRGATRIAGSMDAEAIDEQIRQKAVAKKGIDLSLGANASLGEHYARPSKAANQPCVCGSGRKYKNCCSPLTASEKQVNKDMEEWEKEWTAQ